MVWCHPNMTQMVFAGCYNIEKLIEKRSASGKHGVFRRINILNKKPT